MSDVQHLLDKSALQDLVLRYCRSMDRRDFALARSLYHVDALEDRGDIFRGCVDEFIAWLPQVTAQFELTVHRVFNMLFVVEGDRAEGEIYCEAYHRTHQPDAREMIVGGRFLDRYERRNGEWKFIYRTSTVDRCNLRPVDVQAYAQFVAKTPAGRPDRTDPSYLAVPLLARGVR
jgi:hypothetical protein